MTKTVIDLDPELMAAAAAVLGMKTKKDTVHAALAFAIAEAQRKAERRQPLLNSAGGPDLGNDEVMAGAWLRLSMAMVSPEPATGPIPALVSAGTPRAIRNALVGTERAEFEHRYSEEMAAAAKSLDLTGVLAVLGDFRRIAEITQRHGAGAHARMLVQAADLEQGRPVPTTSAAAHRAEIDSRLGR